MFIVETVEKLVGHDRLQDAQAASLAVEGMGCPCCAVRAGNALLASNGVLAAHVFRADRLAVAAYDPTVISSEQLETAVQNAGDGDRYRYSAQVIHHEPATKVGLW
jgi:copper chaperone CopZ